jgi:hypothetical protein
MFTRKMVRARALSIGVIAGAIVLGCAACSGGGGGAGPDAAAQYHNTGGSVAEVCKAFNNTDLFNKSGDETGLAKYWDAIAQAAPKEISDTVFVVAQAVDKEAKGDMSALTDATSAATKTATQWMVAHCKS